MLRFFDFQVNMRTDQAGRIQAIEVTGRMTGNLEPGLFGVKLTRNAQPIILENSASPGQKDGTPTTRQTGLLPSADQAEVTPNEASKLSHPDKQRGPQPSLYTKRLSAQNRTDSKFAYRVCP
jgi:hypothetical protein